jgi:hypothetical protein
MVRDADDVARIGLVEQLAALREERDDGVRPELLAGTCDLDPHAALEVPARDAHEGDAVAVRRVHVRLDLEDDAGELRLVGLDDPLDRGPRRGRRRQVDERVEHLADAEVVDRRAEEHRRLLAGEEGLPVERRRRVAQELHVDGGLLVFGAEALGELGVVEALDRLVVACCGAIRASGEDPHPFLAQVHHAVEALAHADRPREGHDAHAELALDLVHERERLLHLAVHLVDEGEDRRLAGAADLQQPPRLRLDAIGGVDDHQRRVDGGEDAVGVLEKSWWPGVSSRLTTQPRYSICITDDATEMPRCFSISIQSEVACRVALRALTEPAIWIAPEKSSSFSVSVVLPASGGR